MYIYTHTHTHTHTHHLLSIMNERETQAMVHFRCSNLMRELWYFMFNSIIFGIFQLFLFDELARALRNNTGTNARDATSNFFTSMMLNRALRLSSRMPWFHLPKIGPRKISTSKLQWSNPRTMWSPNAHVTWENTQVPPCLQYRMMRMS